MRKLVFIDWFGGLRRRVCASKRGPVYLLAERVEAAADSLVEPQRGNEENKQPLPVPQGSEPTTITTLVREDEHQRLEVLGQASNIKDTSRDDDRFYSLDIFDNW